MLFYGGTSECIIIIIIRSVFANELDITLNEMWEEITDA